MTNIENFQILDLSKARNVYVVGDIHGAYSKLEASLEELNFDSTTRSSCSVGDLVDRGPENERVLEFLNYPWFHAIMGNHDEMTWRRSEQLNHWNNGGAWMFDLLGKDPDMYEAIQDGLRKLPLLMEVWTPSGFQIGVAHACYPISDWGKADSIVDLFQDDILWDRDRLSVAMRCAQAGHELYIENVDAIYYGHNPVRRPFQSGNQNWIDTYAYSDEGYFTIVDVT